MIHYCESPEYVAQKIADKASHGAYFYSQFKLQGDAEMLSFNISNLIRKLSETWHLNLNPRQRTYRLKQKREPIADLVVLKDKSGMWEFTLMITTPFSNDYNDSKTNVKLKPVVGMRISEAQSEQFEQPEQQPEQQPELILNREVEQQQIKLIQQYFKDNEKFKLVQNKPYLQVDIGGSSPRYLELVRMSHSSKNEKKYDKNRKNLKNYSWTWRFDEPTVKFLSDIYMNIINKIISNKDKSSALEELKQFYAILKPVAVFKGNRHQLGKIVAFMMRYFYKKTGKDFRKLDYYIPLELQYLRRKQNYADDCEQYMIMRYSLEKLDIRLHKNEVDPWEFGTLDVFDAAFGTNDLVEKIEAIVKARTGT